MDMKATVDANQAVARVAYACSDLAVIYPITPSSPMGERADELSAGREKNIWGTVPEVVEMQSEGGVAGAFHGALGTGALATTFTSSQGLLLMIPNLYRIAGELLPGVLHVAARALAVNGTCIFGDHSDVMACRQTGFAMLASASVQEAQDLALVAHAATLETRVPFLHFFDGFRTSHEVQKIDELPVETIRALIDDDAVAAQRARGLSPEHPVFRGTVQNSDVYFQGREAQNPYYDKVPGVVQRKMDELAARTGRAYRIFDYYGAPDATRVVVAMASGVETVRETVEEMNRRGDRVGVVAVRLYRPFARDAFLSVLPATVTSVTVLDRTKECGSAGEPLYLDVATTIDRAFRDGTRTGARPTVYAARYALGGKEFTPQHVKAVFDNMSAAQPKDGYAIGVEDDLTGRSIPPAADFAIDHVGRHEGVFWGLGSDGTVGANKNSIQLIGDETEWFVQGYFHYDSKKSGGVTISHLRFSKTPVRAPYLIDRADFIACHDPSYLTRYNMLKDAKRGGTFLLNCPWMTTEELEKHLPDPVKRAIAEKELFFYGIDGTSVAESVGLRGRTSTVMQAAFFYLFPSLMPYERAKVRLKALLERKFAQKGEDVVRKNCEAIDRAEGALHKIEYPAAWKDANGRIEREETDDEYVRSFIRPVLELRGNDVPVSAFTPDGSVPTGTTKLEKHGVAAYLPRWIKENCIQCNQCSFVCPHAAVRPFVFDENVQTPFDTLPTTGKSGTRFRIQVAAEHCTGCGVCADTCPTKEKALVMQPSARHAEEERENWAFAQAAKKADVRDLQTNTVKGSQFRTPLFEFSYACAGCGETAYIKLLTQLFGDRAIIANATGCSSIYGGSSPTCPYTKNEDGRGPAWASSLFEDNAEFGLGMRLACDYADKNHSVWIVGGDGWAYDIGFGGLDHLLSQPVNVNILVLDSEVYSNTGGQSSKATPLGATARFAVRGKRTAKKQLGLMAMTYGNAYVAQVALGADKQQCLNAFLEAEAYNGVSLLIAYSPCIAHGVNMQKSVQEEKFAVESGYFPLFRYHPDKPFRLDSKAPSVPLEDFYARENRFAALTKEEELLTEAKTEAARRYEFYRKLSEILR